MKFSNLSIVVSLLFPPSFVLLIQYFDFKSVAFAYMLFMLGYLILSVMLKESLKNISTPLIYFTFVIFAYMLSSMEFIKIIPALISATFFIFFLVSFLQKKELILGFTKKFYKKKLDENEEIYLAKADGYWAIVIFINTLIQVYLVFQNDNELWAFYSSVGWYIYIFIALLLQILYGKITMIRSK